MSYLFSYFASSDDPYTHLCKAQLINFATPLMVVFAKTCAALVDQATARLFCPFVHDASVWRLLATRFN